MIKMGSTEFVVQGMFPGEIRRRLTRLKMKRGIS